MSPCRLYIEPCFYVTLVKAYNIYSQGDVRDRGAGGGGARGFSPPPNNFPYICDFYKLRILKSFRLVNNIFITYIAKYSIYFWLD